MRKVWGCACMVCILCSSGQNAGCVQITFVSVSIDNRHVCTTGKSRFHIAWKKWWLRFYVAKGSDFLAGWSGCGSNDLLSYLC